MVRPTEKYRNPVDDQAGQAHQRAWFGVHRRRGGGRDEEVQDLSAGDAAGVEEGEGGRTGDNTGGGTTGGGDNSGGGGDNGGGLDMG